MNNFFKTISLLILLLVGAQSLISQDSFSEKVKGIPYIQDIQLKKYGIKNSNYEMVQDTNGILFVANSNGVLEFNGYHRDLIPTRGNPNIVRYNNSIYVSSYNSFGILQYNKNKHGIKELNITPSGCLDSIRQPKQLFVNNNKIFIQTNNSLLVIKGTQCETIPISPETSIFNIADSVIYVLNKEGLLELKTNTFALDKTTGKSNLPENIIQIINYSIDSLLLVAQHTPKLGFLNRDNFYPLHSPVNNLLDQTSITDVVIHENKIYLGTLSSGIITLSNEGTIINQIGENHGLFDAKVNKLFIDRNDNLWALHDGGLSRIEISSGFLYYNHATGIRGNINKIKKFEDKFYLTTSKGVYILKNNEKQPYELQYIKVKGLNTNCYDLYDFNGNLTVSTEDGIYKIQGDKAFLFYNKFRKKFKSVHRSKKNPDLLFIGKEDGVSVVKYKNGLFIHQGDVKNIPYSITSIAEDKEGNIWLSAQHQGIFIIKAFDSYSEKLNWDNYELSDSSIGDIKWKKLYSTSRGIYVSTSEGLFQFDRETNKLYRDTLIPEKYTGYWIFPIIEDQKGNLWYNINSKERLQSKTLLIADSRGKKINTLTLPLSRLKNFTINTIEPEKQNYVWIGGTNGLIRMDIGKINQKPIKYDLIIHKVITTKDSVLTFNYHSHKKEDKRPILKYRQNNIKFEYSATDYISEANLIYSTMLKGYENTWSEYNNQHFREFRNLREGRYVFKVKARNVFGNTSEVLEFPFEIEPPIYRTWYAYAIYLVSIGFFLFLVFKLRAYYFAKEKFKLENIINERTEEVLQQKEKADSLIERLLPKETVKELKSGRKAGPYHYNMVTVLFGDIKGFTKITEKLEELNAMELLDKLDRYFLEFDSIVEKYNIEKIKTIGDAYMCAGGIPEVNHTNPVEVIVAAMEMQHYMKKMKEASSEDKNIWDLRIGVDTGPVIAGVIGRSKVAYDIWGSTVNMASRMEASGEPGKINITGNTFMLIKDFFICKYRGKMPVKNKGDIDMYFVENFKPHFSNSLKGMKPNRNFQIQLQLLRFNDLEETILEKLEQGLSNDLYYHNVKHTIDVVTQVELIGKSEDISDEELLIVKTAALFHDVGHLISYDNHEEESVKIATRMLPKYNYSKKQIEEINKLIRATKMPPQPTNLLEKIICDADLDYLGRTDFVPVAYNLYKELSVKNKIESFEEWKQIEIEFIKKHSYFTPTAQKIREVNKRKQLEKIIKEMKPENSGK